MNEPTERKADWLGWWIQFIVGFLVGILIGFMLVCRRHGWRWWHDANAAVFFSLGLGLLIGAIATQYGDRLWMGGRYSRFLPPDEIQHSTFRKILAVLIGVAVAVMMIYSSLVSFGVF